MADANALRPCPFCGSVELENLAAAAYGSAVHCINCGARGPCVFDVLQGKAPDGVADGLEAWNLRFEVS